MDRTRTRIIAAAAALLDAGGRNAVSTRAVGAAAGVQAPTIYRLFGDKRGLLDAVALEGFFTYLDDSGPAGDDVDPVDDLRHGWDVHVSFGLAHPYMYSLIFGQPVPGKTSPAVRAADEVIGRYMHRIAQGGRLRVPEPTAVQIASAAGCGTVLTLIGRAEADRDLAVSDIAREAMITAVTTDAAHVTGTDVAASAVGLRALLPGAPVLSPAEAGLLTEWLDRLSSPKDDSEVPR